MLKSIRVLLTRPDFPSIAWLPWTNLHHHSRAFSISLPALWRWTRTTWEPENHDEEPGHVDLKTYVHASRQTVVLDKCLSLFLIENLEITMTKKPNNPRNNLLGRICWYLITSRKECIHGEICKPMKILQATVDSNFSGKMSVREFVDNLQKNWGWRDDLKWKWRNKPGLFYRKGIKSLSRENSCFSLSN